MSVSIYGLPSMESESQSTISNSPAEHNSHMSGDKLLYSKVIVPKLVEIAETLPNNCAETLPDNCAETVTECTGNLAESSGKPCFFTFLDNVLKGMAKHPVPICERERVCTGKNSVLSSAYTFSLPRTLMDDFMKFGIDSTDNEKTAELLKDLKPHPEFVVNEKSSCHNQQNETFSHSGFPHHMHPDGIDCIHDDVGLESSNKYFCSEFLNPTLLKNNPGVCFDFDSSLDINRSNLVLDSSNSIKSNAIPSTCYNSDQKSTRFECLSSAAKDPDANFKLSVEDGDTLSSDFNVLKSNPYNLDFSNAKERDVFSSQINKLKDLFCNSDLSNVTLLDTIPIDFLTLYPKFTNDKRSKPSKMDGKASSNPKQPNIFPLDCLSLDRRSKQAGSVQLTDKFGCSIPFSKLNIINHNCLNFYECLADDEASSTCSSDYSQDNNPGPNCEDWSSEECEEDSLDEQDCPMADDKFQKNYSILTDSSSYTSDSSHSSSSVSKSCTPKDDEASSSCSVSDASTKGSSKNEKSTRSSSSQSPKANRSGIKSMTSDCLSSLAPLSSEYKLNRVEVSSGRSRENKFLFTSKYIKDYASSSDDTGGEASNIIYSVIPTSSESNSDSDEEILFQSSSDESSSTMNSSENSALEPVSSNKNSASNTMKFYGASASASRFYIRDRPFGKMESSNAEASSRQSSSAEASSRQSSSAEASSCQSYSAEASSCQSSSAEASSRQSSSAEASSRLSSSDTFLCRKKYDDDGTLPSAYSSEDQSSSIDSGELSSRLLSCIPSSITSKFNTCKALSAPNNDSFSSTSFSNKNDVSTCTSSSDDELSNTRHSYSKIASRCYNSQHALSGRKVTNSDDLSSNTSKSKRNGTLSNRSNTLVSSSIKNESSMTFSSDDLSPNQSGSELSESSSCSSRSRTCEDSSSSGDFVTSEYESLSSNDSESDKDSSRLLKSTSEDSDWETYESSTDENMEYKILISTSEDGGSEGSSAE